MRWPTTGALAVVGGEKQPPQAHASDDNPLAASAPPSNTPRSHTDLVLYPRPIPHLPTLGL
jgi:hypothetical protein